VHLAPDPFVGGADVIRELRKGKGGPNFEGEAKALAGAEKKSLPRRICNLEKEINTVSTRLREPPSSAGGGGEKRILQARTDLAKGKNTSHLLPFLGREVIPSTVRQGRSPSKGGCGPALRNRERKIRKDQTLIFRPREKEGKRGEVEGRGRTLPLKVD